MRVVPPQYLHEDAPLSWRGGKEEWFELEQRNTLWSCGIIDWANYSRGLSKWLNEQVDYCMDRSYSPKALTVISVEIKIDQIL